MRGSFARRPAQPELHGGLGMSITMDEHAHDLSEVSKDELNITFEILSQNIHPADLERVRLAFAATRAVIGAYEIDFRVPLKNDIRWISARGQGDDADITDRIMFGIFLDVTPTQSGRGGQRAACGRGEPQSGSLVSPVPRLEAPQERGHIFL